MVEDDDGKSYQPTVLSLNAVSGTGFQAEPYIYNSSTIYFKTKYDCEVWWYYSRVSNPVSAEAFAGKWEQAMHGDSITAEAGVLESIVINKDILESFPYIVFSTSEGFRGEVYTTPVMLHLQNVQGNTDATGFRVTDVSKYEITLTSFENGKVYYYETNDSTVPTKTGFDAAYMSTDISLRGDVTVLEGEKNVEISISGSKKYVILQLENYDENDVRIYYNVVQVNIADGSSSDSNSDSGSGSVGDVDAILYGFTLKSIDVRNSKLTILPQYTGELTVSIGTENQEWILTTSKYNAVKGELLDVTYPSGLTALGDKQLYIYIKLVGSNGYKYTEFPPIELIPAN